MWGRGWNRELPTVGAVLLWSFLPSIFALYYKWAVFFEGITWKWLWQWKETERFWILFEIFKLHCEVVFLWCCELHFSCFLSLIGSRLLSLFLKQGIHFSTKLDLIYFQKLNFMSFSPVFLRLSHQLSAFLHFSLVDNWFELFSCS